MNYGIGMYFQAQHIPHGKKKRARRNFATIICVV